MGGNSPYAGKTYDHLPRFPQPLCAIGRRRNHLDKTFVEQLRSRAGDPERGAVSRVERRLHLASEGG